MGNNENTDNNNNNNKNGVQNECALVFRSRCDPGPALERRILRWSRSLSARPLGQRCDIWVSSDHSPKLYTEQEILFAGSHSKVLKTLEAKGIQDEDPKKDTVKQMRYRKDIEKSSTIYNLTDNALWKSLPENDIHDWWWHSYTVHNVASTFPNIFSLDRLCRKNLGWGYCDIWARVYQTEFILLWMIAARDVGFNHYSYVWVIQDDVEYTGDPATFLFSPDYLNTDFVSPHGIISVSPTHAAKEVSTLSFAPNQASGKLYFAGEGIRRYSWSFLSLIYHFALLGESAWSEFSAPTICKHYPDRCKSTSFTRDMFSPRWEWEDQTTCILTAEILDSKFEPWPFSMSSIWTNKWVHKVTDGQAPQFVHGTCRPQWLIHVGKEVIHYALVDTIDNTNSSKSWGDIDICKQKCMGNDLCKGFLLKQDDCYFKTDVVTDVIVSTKDIVLFEKNT
jgi:hypothetical protein